MFWLPLPLWAVHLSDGVLSWPWLAAGFALAAALALLAAHRVREEEVPRIALLTAAFFVASSIHIRLGPTSAHLLLNGLVGVVLGRRAPLAILVGVALQAALIAHGGFSTIGVNACVQAVPALTAGWLFHALRALPWAEHRLFRGAVVAGSAVVWGGCLVFGVAALWTNPLGEVARVNGQAAVVSALSLGPAWDVLRHPVTLAALGLFALGCAFAERRMENAPEFPLGMLVGVYCVLATTALAGATLLLDGASTWATVVKLMFLAHLPLAVVEGLILGCVVSFLARVKPGLLGELPQGGDEDRPIAPPRREVEPVAGEASRP
jgi:cobalt/nickel transport system permease protein